MLKHMLLIGAAAISLPAMAQETTPPADDMMPPAEQTTPADPTDTTTPAPQMPDTTMPPADPSTMPTDPATPTDPTMPTDPVPAPDDTTTPPADPMAPAPADPATTPPAEDPATDPGATASAATPDQVAQIVSQEFPTYDADATKELNETEFATWMKKLRTATDPSVDPESEQVKSWIGQAFAAADADKSGGVTEQELTGFLSRGA